jgi:hypothetical protein
MHIVSDTRGLIHVSEEIVLITISFMSPERLFW